MDGDVEGAGVEEEVGVVEEDFADEDAEGKLPGYGGEGGQCWCYDVGAGFGAEGHDEEEEGGVQSHVEELVSSYDVEGVPFLGGGGLLWYGLDFVAMGKVGRNGIQRLEEEGGDPVAEELDEESAEEFDCLGWV